MDISRLLEKSMQDHDHLCPRQILGVRIGLAGMKALGFDEPPTKKRRWQHGNSLSGLQ
jgi:formylmethanofuran dehydrogenase subunit E